MKNFVAKQKCWVVVSNPIVATLCELEEGQQLSTKNQIVEIYYSERVAHSRMRQFNPGWKPTEI